MPLLPTYYYKWELKLTGTENVLVSYIQAGEILDFFSRKTDEKLAMFQKKKKTRKMDKQSWICYSGPIIKIQLELQYPNRKTLAN